MTWFAVGSAQVAAVLANAVQAKVQAHSVVYVDDPRDLQYLPRRMAQRNCRNCGAPAELDRCSYCLTPSENHHAR